MISARAIAGLPEIERGADLAALILQRARPTPQDIVVIAHKVISKAEGRVRQLADIEPSARAHELAGQLEGKDARHVQAILDESAEIVRSARGVLICRTQHGFVCANAGVDSSNTAHEESVILLPEHPDLSAQRLRARLAELGDGQPAPAVLVTDSFGRAWRHGQCDVALGIAGLQPLDDWRGRSDSAGRELRATWIALADEVAAAADLARAKDSREPVVLISGLGRHVSPGDGPGAVALLRKSAEDLFR